MKTYILYHANCPDGFGAATAAWLKLGPDADYIRVSYDKPMPEMERGSKVFILDFSYGRDVLMELSARMERVVVLDHHATAQEALADIVLHGEESEVIFDMQESGAVLAWEYFHGEDVPPFLLYLQDRDLWRWELPRSKEVSAALRSYPFEFSLWADFIALPAGGRAGLPEKLANEGEALLRLINQQVATMARHHCLMIFVGGEVLPFSGQVPNDPGAWVAPLANATVFVSEVAQELLEMHPECRFSAYFSVRTDGRWQFGLRSRPDFDCSVIAKTFGGGGHKQASGFIL